MSREIDTKKKILDAAQHLFARDGFRGASFRAITNMAKVNLAAINYHFGSKEALLKAVLERHLVPLNQVRMNRIAHVRDAARAQGKRPLIRDLLLAFIEPTLEFRDTSPDAVDFVSLVGRVFYDPDNTVRKTFIQLVWPLYRMIVETFREALPDLQEKIFLWRIHLMIGAVSHTMNLCCSRMYADPEEFPLHTDTETVIDVLVSFIAAGMEAQESI